MAIESEIINGTIYQTINSAEFSLDSYIGIGIAGVTAIFLYYQIHKQNKVDSARFTIDYINQVLTENKSVIDILHKRVQNKSITFDSDKSVRVLLNGIENTIQFANDGIIKKTHLLTTLRITLTMIKNDPKVQEIITEAQTKNPKAFELVVKFINEKIS